MVLNDLGKKINEALNAITRVPVIDEKAMDAMLKEICAALLQSDVNVKLVQTLRKNIKQLVNLEQLGAGQNRRKIINKTVFDELCRLIDPDVEQWQPKRAPNHSNVIMFVGLQGSGKTTSCTKLAYHYQRKGWKVGMVCADTFRAGAFDQLKQNATKAKIPFYGSYTESDPVQLAMDGVQKFKQDAFEIIIVDTSGRHRQESDLFDEMTQIANVISPDNVIFVLDGSIGQAAESQARAFNDAINVGSIIITKMDGHAKGGGSISAVAATGSPIIFIGTGEHMHDLDTFTARSFVSKMLGMGDLGGLMESVKDLKIDENGDMMKRISQGQFTLRDLYEQYQNIMQLGPLSKVMSMFPGMQEGMLPAGSEQNAEKAFKRMLCMMDSMTAEELDSDGKCFVNEPTRILRVCRGSGAFPEEMANLFQSYHQMSKMIKTMGGKNGMLSMMNKSGGAPASAGQGGMPNAAQMQRMQQQMRNNPQMAQQMQQMQQMMGAGGGGMGGMQQMMQQMMGGGGGGMQQMMQQMMGGGGGGGGMPDMSALMGAFGGGAPAAGNPRRK